MSYTAYESSGTNGSTWTISLSAPSVASSDGDATVTINIVARYSGTNKNCARVADSYWLYIDEVGHGATSLVTMGASPTDTTGASSWARGVAKSQSYSMAISDVFTSSNPTTRTVSYRWRSQGVNTATYYKASPTDTTATNISYCVKGDDTQGCSGTITLYAAPTFSTSDPGGTYRPGDSFTVNISSLSAKCGGYITACTLYCSGQSASRTSNGSLSVSVPMTRGTYSPYVVVTDSRGQTSTQYLSDIVVRDESVGCNNVSATRIDSSDKLSDETTAIYAKVQATFSYTNSVLTAPTVSVDNSTVTVSWYRNYNSSTGFSNAVSSWSDISSGTTLYGKITSRTFNVDTTYTIRIVPKAMVGSETITGSAMSAFLSQRFFLLAGRAGGHGLGIGMKPTDDELQIAMDTRIFGNLIVRDNQSNMRSLLNYFYPVGSYYETSDANFNPNNVWGGNWSMDSVGKVTVGYGTGYTQGGGSTSQSVPIAYHRHTDNTFSVSASGTAYSTGSEHSHTITNKYDHDATLGGNGTRYTASATLGTSTNFSSCSYDGTHSHAVSVSGSATGSTSYAGTSGASISVMQPYIVVYRWHRLPD